MKQLSNLTTLALACTLLPILHSAADAIEPNWIWGSGNAQNEAASGECEFQRTFVVDGKTNSAIIELAADNQFTLRVNNRYVGAGDDLATLTRYDITPLIHSGENSIYVRCRNDDRGPAGFVCRLTIDGSDGNRRTVVTDKSWQAKLQKSGTWDPSIRDRTPWESPVVLGLLGMAPWNAINPSEDIVTVKRQAQSNGPFELHDGDRVVFLGNTFIEREQSYGFVEFALTRRHPDRSVTFRNLGWSGDTVFGHARARFGTVQDGFEHLETQVHLVEPTLILVAYGSNAAFDGPNGIDAFIAGYERLLNVLEATGARITLIAPTKHENLGAPLPDPSMYNRNLRSYRTAIQKLADRRALGFIDLHDASDSRETGPEFLTDNGIHLTETGYRFTAEAIEKKLDIQPPKPAIEIDARTRKTMASAATVSEVTTSNGGLTFSVTLTHLPFPAAAEYDPSPSFELQISGLSSGDYAILADGAPILSTTEKELADGISIVGGPDLAQADSLRKTIHRKNQLFFYRWRPQNETYLFLFRKHEQGNNAVEIPKFDPLVAEQEAEISRLRMPIPHRYEVKRN